MLTLTVLLLIAACVSLFSSWNWGKPSLHLAVFFLVMIEVLRVIPK